MSVKPINSKPDAVSHGLSEGTAGEQSYSWLAALRARLGLPGAPTLRATLEDALKGEGQAFSVEEREMLLRILRFGTLRVEDVMIPRADIIAVDENESIRALLKAFDSAGVSRMPLYRETLDEPRGMVHVKDVLHWLIGDARGQAPAGSAAKASEPDLSRVDLSKPIVSAKLGRPMIYVPPSMPAANLLLRMQATHIHMALVVDEYGGTDGLVTIEDLVEQIVGDIEDEHDVAEAAHIITEPKLGLVASARTPIKQLEEHLGIKLLRPEEEEDIDTLGGLMFSLLGRVPVRGELVRHPSGLELEVLDADPRRLKKVKIHQPGVVDTPLPEDRKA